MNLTVKLTSSEAEEVIAAHVLGKFKLSASDYEANVTISAYSGVEISLSPKSKDEPTFASPAPPSSRADETVF